jgi:hypothetical protein
MPIKQYELLPQLDALGLFAGHAKPLRHVTGLLALAGQKNEPGQLCADTEPAGQYEPAGQL